MDSFPVTASSVARFFHMKGSTLERYYKDFLSDFEDWDQKEHAKKWMLIAKNLGKYCSIDETKKAKAKFEQEEDRKAKQRKNGRTKYAVKRAGKKKPKGKKRGRKRIRRKALKPEVLEPVGDTLVELLTRARYILPKAGNKWGENQKERIRLLFKLYPQIREAYSLICLIRAIFRNKKLTREQARKKLHEWYDKVAACTLREIKTARDCIKAKEEEVLNYFNEHHTNAAAESLNSKIKGFRAQVHGGGRHSFLHVSFVQDIRIVLCKGIHGKSELRLNLFFLMVIRECSHQKEYKSKQKQSKAQSLATFNALSACGL